MRRHSTTFTTKCRYFADFSDYLSLLVGFRLIYPIIDLILWEGVSAIVLFYKLNFVSHPTPQLLLQVQIVEEPKWSLTTAMYFSGTIFTTIGYGDVVCETVWGRVVTVIYAIVGIPIMLITLNHLGKFLYKWINAVVAFYNRLVDQVSIGLQFFNFYLKCLIAFPFISLSFLFNISYIFCLNFSLFISQ